MTVLNVVRHDLLTLRKSLLWKVVLGASMIAPVAGFLIGVVMTDDLTFRFLLLTAWLVVGFTIPLVAVLTAASAIVSRRDTGQLRLLLGTPTNRLEVVVGTFCTRLLIVEAALALGLLVAGAVLTLLPVPIRVGQLLGFGVFTALVAAAYVSIGLAISTMTSSQLRAVAVTLVVFLWALFWPQVTTILHEIVTDLFGLAVSPTGFQILGRLSPFGAYSQVISDPGAIYGVEPTTSLLKSGVMAGVLVLWIVIPPIVGLRQFSKADI